MKSTILRLETAIVVALPVTALLIVGAVGTRSLEKLDVFLPVLILCIILVSLSEIALMHVAQHMLKRQYSELLEACQEYLAGMSERRVSIHGDTALKTLASMINMLLATKAQELPVRDMPEAARPLPEVATGELQAQLQMLIQEVLPVTTGDLRVRVRVPPGEVGMIADLCNAFIEELAELITWTRYSSQRFMEDTRHLFEQTSALAQVTEEQMIRFAQTTEAVERVVAFMQRQSNMLQLSADLLERIREQLPLAIDQADKGGEVLSTALKSTTFLDEDIQRLNQILVEMQQKTHAHTTAAESLIADFYSFAQRIHQSSVAILQAVDQIAALINLAEQWNASMQAFQLPEGQGQAERDS